MTVTELNALIGGEIITKEADRNKELTCGITCDLLSWVMAKGAQGAAWVTVQTHMNVIAVASLHDMACVILAEDVGMDEDVIKKADDEDICVIKTKLSSYEICGIMYENGIKPSLLI